MKKKTVCISICILLIIAVLPTSGTIVEKSSILSFGGKTIYVGGNGPGNYSSIQDAIDDASDGDTVFVYDDSSPYYENVVVNKSINLIGEDKNTTIINGNNIGHVIHISADRVTINGFTVERSKTYYSGIRICSNHNKILGNKISFNDCGIWLVHSNYNFISKNIISNNIYGNKLGLYFHNCSNNSISENIIANNEDGIALKGLNKNNNISGNTIKNNSHDGMWLYDFSNNNVISNNTIRSNFETGIRVIENSSQNIIYHNNFINNTENANDECNNSWDNGYPSCGNYWSDYIGVDNFSGENQNVPSPDGVGDLPYDLPCEYATDWYPLMEPYGMTKLLMNMGGGLFRFLGGIKNVGNKTAFNVQWKITIDGGFVLLGRHSSGTIPKPLLAGEETSVTSKLIVGFGPIIITVIAWADNAPMVSRTISGFLLLFFIKINPGGGI